jgi:hypothetical protein
MSELVLVGFEPVDEYDDESSCDEPEAEGKYSIEWK